MNLSEKIELLIKRKQLSASQFADKLGIPRSSISHIISGRNKPSLDVVQKILKVFPEITAEDLLFEDRTLRLQTNQPEQNTMPVDSAPSLFDAVNPEPSESPVENLPEQTIVKSNLRRNKETTIPEPQLGFIAASPVATTFSSSAHIEKKIERVIIFYSDGTFSESKPQK
jgi:transcriptional regulator with XRE-family HTH domain